jgi:NAD(P)H-nitrite reductase large subunit
MKKILIIGNSAAGISCAETVRQSDKEAQITIVGKENYPAYRRYLLPEFLAGEVPEEKLAYREPGFFKANDLQVALGQEIERIDLKRRRAITRAGDKESQKERQAFEYDILVLAAGASSIMPETKGIAKRGVFGFRSVGDVKNISEILPVCDTTCVWGAGLVGLKAAEALQKRGLEVKVITRSQHIFLKDLPYETNEMLYRLFKEKGVQITTDADITEILGNGDVKAIRLNSGKVIACQIVVVAQGFSPAVKMLKDLPVNCNPAVVVDAQMRTAVPEVFACGDICGASNWGEAEAQGRVAGENICAGQAVYTAAAGARPAQFFGQTIENNSSQPVS